MTLREFEREIAMDINLVTFSKSGARKEFPIESRKIIIGRKTDADLRIPLNEVSREHCELEVLPNKVVLRDLNSSNGTYVNEQKIAEANLKAGDEIIVGPIIFTVQIDGIPEEIVPPMSHKAAAASAPEEPTVVSDDAGFEGMDEEIDLDSLEELDMDDVSDFDLDEFDSDEIDEVEEVVELGEEDLVTDDSSEI